jgi:hypothetical protein
LTQRRLKYSDGAPHRLFKIAHSCAVRVALRWMREHIPTVWESAGEKQKKGI